MQDKEIYREWERYIEKEEKEREEGRKDSDLKIELIEGVSDKGE